MGYFERKRIKKYGTLGVAFIKNDKLDYIGKKLAQGRKVNEKRLFWWPGIC